MIRISTTISATMYHSTRRLRRLYWRVSSVPAVRAIRSSLRSSERCRSFSSYSSARRWWSRSRSGRSQRASGCEGDFDFLALAGGVRLAYLGEQGVEERAGLRRVETEQHDDAVAKQNGASAGPGCDHERGRGETGERLEGAQVDVMPGEQGARGDRPPTGKSLEGQGSPPDETFSFKIRPERRLCPSRRGQAGRRL